MSVMLSYKKGDRVYMATDATMTYGDNLTTETAEDSLKIRIAPSGLLVGVTGERVVRQEIFTMLEDFTLDKRGCLTKEHITSEIVPKLFNRLIALDMVEKDNDNLPYTGAHVFLAYKDKMFMIVNKFVVLRSENYLAINISAYPLSVYPMANLDEEAEINEQLVKILKFLSKHVTTVGAPYVTIDSVDKKIKFWEE